MKREGANSSVWQTVDDFIPKKVTPSRHYDVAIVGGGMTGVVTALLLQQAGMKCILLEAFNLGFGTTGGTTAHLNTLLDTPYTTITKNFGAGASRMVADAAAGAIRLIDDHVTLYGIDCAFARTRAYLFAQDQKEADALEKICHATNEAGVIMNMTTQLPIAVPFAKVAQVEDQAKFNPVQHLFALAKEFERRGGHILINATVHDVDHDEPLHVHTSRGTVRAQKIVYATHIPPGINLVHLRCAPWRSYVMAFRLGGDDYPEGLFYDMKDPYHYYRSQQIDGKMYMIAGGNDHKTGTEDNTAKAFLDLLVHIESVFRVRTFTHKWSSQFFEPADGLPYIGVLPGHSDSFYVATGYGGNGMIYSHVAAQEISHQILHQKSKYDNLFSPSRIKPVAGFSNFVDHNADVVKHFVGKYLAIEQLEELAGLAPGEGKVVRFENTRIAVSKDMSGKLHAVSSTCTHMKCNVSWNSAERSWDCPCHGARYDIDGKVITGPANHDLEPIPLADLVAPR